jgi:hypothetical protein
MFGAEIDSLTVEECVGSVCAPVFRRTGQQQTSAAAPWTQATVEISPGTTTVRWIVTDPFADTSQGGDVSIDEIRIVSTPP